MIYTEAQNIKRAYETYLKSTDTALSDVYGKYSSKKASAWKHCEDVCEHYKGENLRIVGHNCDVFTVGFVFTDDTGKRSFCWITPTYTRYTHI